MKKAHYMKDSPIKKVRKSKKILQETIKKRSLSLVSLKIWFLVNHNGMYDNPLNEIRLSYCYC